MRSMRCTASSNERTWLGIYQMLSVVICRSGDSGCSLCLNLKMLWLELECVSLDRYPVNFRVRTLVVERVVMKAVYW